MSWNRKFGLFALARKADVYDCPTHPCHQLQEHIEKNNLHKKLEWLILSHLFEIYYIDLSKEQEKFQHALKGEYGFNQSRFSNHLSSPFMSELDCFFEIFLRTLKDTEKPDNLILFFNIFKHFQEKFQCIMDHYLDYYEDWNNGIKILLGIKKLQSLYSHNVYKNNEHSKFFINAFFKNKYWERYEEKLKALNCKRKTCENQIITSIKLFEEIFEASKKTKKIDEKKIDKFNILLQKKDSQLKINNHNVLDEKTLGRPFSYFSSLYMKYEVAEKEIKTIKILEKYYLMLMRFSRSSIKADIEYIYDGVNVMFRQIFQNSNSSSLKGKKICWERYLKNYLNRFMNNFFKNTKKLTAPKQLIDKCIELIKSLESKISDAINKSIYISTKNKSNISPLWDSIYNPIIAILDKNIFNGITDGFINIAQLGENLNKIKEDVLDKINQKIINLDTVHVDSFLSKIKEIINFSGLKNKLNEKVFCFIAKEFDKENSVDVPYPEFLSDYHPRLKEIATDYKNKLINSFEKINMVEDAFGQIDLAKYSKDNILDMHFMSIYGLPATDREKVYILYCMMHELDNMIYTPDKEKSAIFLNFSTEPLFKNQKNIYLHPGKIFDKLFERFKEKVYSKAFKKNIVQYFSAKKRDALNRQRKFDNKKRSISKHSGFSTVKLGHRKECKSAKLNNHHLNGKGILNSKKWVEKQNQEERCSILLSCWQCVALCVSRCISLVCSFFTWIYAGIKNRLVDTSPDVDRATTTMNAL